MDNNKEASQTQLLYDEVGFPYVNTLPDNAFKCRHWLEFYRLKERKRRHSRDNIELNVGSFYLIKATRSNVWYVRDIIEFTDPKNLLNEITQGKIYLLYTEDIAESIRKDVERSGLSYAKFLQRAEAAMREEDVDAYYYYDTGKITHKQIQQDRIKDIKKY